MKNKEKIMIIISCVALLIIALGISYAYFSAQITGAESSATITTTTGTLNLTFDGGSVITASNIYPQSAAIATKTFTVTGNNTTATTMPYSLNLIIDSNTFGTGSIKYTLTSTNTSSTGSIVPSISTQTGIATGSSTISLGSGYFNDNTTNKIHTYVLNFYYPDTGSNQNAEQGSTFSAHVSVVSSEAGIVNNYLSSLSITSSAGASYSWNQTELSASTTLEKSNTSDMTNPVVTAIPVDSSVADVYINGVLGTTYTYADSTYNDLTFTVTVKSKITTDVRTYTVHVYTETQEPV